ncbi:MAG: hypothetical protein KGL39_26915 [Patescibacteria group bacterium]|nr:hypothetical protein [Patescibacteria group bacterium]
MSIESTNSRILKDLAILISKFRILWDWKIKYNGRAKYKGQCNVNEENKRAIIYGWGNEVPYPADYLFHEVLHIAFRAAKAGGREGEEIFVQDLCVIYLKGKE